MIRDFDLKEDQNLNFNSSSMNFSEISDLKSVNSLDCLFSCHESRKVYYEKCLLNKKDFFMFKGKYSNSSNNNVFLGKRGKFDEDNQSTSGKDKNYKDKKRIKSLSFIKLDKTDLQLKNTGLRSKKKLSAFNK